METQQSPNDVFSPDLSQPQETIFSDLADTKPYEKSLKTARIWLYVIAALQAGIGIWEYASTQDPTVALVAGMIDAGIGVIFLALALWSYKKPAAAFITALATYVVIHIGMMFVDPTNIVKGFILKILIVVALVRAYKDAREVERLRESIN
ncbi:hypothetical protein [Flavisolibacter nicotianae]|uniref:hypothetical protein n=1 Tax=Flavisolibacter nicotianae TaxID=2364882 RepID=UPI000EB13272|nr:hypothetical protein [Flavisolibacter nicotianae]